MKIEQLAWFGVMTQGVNQGAATQADAEAWHNQYPHEKIPVLWGGDGQMLEGGAWSVECFPTIYPVDQEGNFTGLEDCLTWNNLDALLATIEG